MFRNRLVLMNNLRVEKPSIVIPYSCIAMARTRNRCLEAYTSEGKNDPGCLGLISPSLLVGLHIPKKGILLLSSK